MWIFYGENVAYFCRYDGEGMQELFLALWAVYFS